MKRIAVFPGSFDPITKGHEDLIKRAIPLFDEIIVAIGVNANKQYMFSLEQRKKWIEQTFAEEPKIKVDDYTGLTIEYCKNIDAQFIIRGLRDVKDFEYEKSIAQMNRELSQNIETISIITHPRYAPYSSSIVRDILRNNGDVKQFIPNKIEINE